MKRHQIKPEDTITYEVAFNEPLHPDPTVVSRMNEYALSDCPYGCKVYADPLSNVKVVAHSSTYGCYNASSKSGD